MFFRKYDGESRLVQPGWAQDGCPWLSGGRVRIIKRKLANPTYHHGGERAVNRVTLNQLRPGERGRVESCLGHGPIYQRLCEMGFVEGATLRVVRYAPF